MAAAAAIPQLTIFEMISRGDLGEVQGRVQANPGIMEEQLTGGFTPLMWAINDEQPAIALWLIQHRGDHDLEATDRDGWSAIHQACCNGSLEVVQQLVAAGADAAAVVTGRYTTLMLAASSGRADIAAFLLTLPVVRGSIDDINADHWTALSGASFKGHTSIVQLLLDAGANPTIQQGNENPLSRATHNHHHAVVALLTAAIAEPQRPRLLFKARSIVDATFAIRKAQREANTTVVTTTIVTTITTTGIGETNIATTIKSTSSGTERPSAEMQSTIIAAAPKYLRKRVKHGEALPRVVVDADVDDGENGNEEEEEEGEKREAVLTYTLGMIYGEKGDGLPREVFTELMELMVPRWDAAARRP